MRLIVRPSFHLLNFLQADIIKPDSTGTLQKEKVDYGILLCIGIRRCLELKLLERPAVSACETLLGEPAVVGIPDIDHPAAGTDASLNVFRFDEIAQPVFPVRLQAGQELLCAEIAFEDTFPGKTQTLRTGDKAPGIPREFAIRRRLRRPFSCVVDSGLQFSREISVFQDVFPGS